MRIFLRLSAISLMPFYCSLLVTCSVNNAKGVKQTQAENDANNFYVMKELKDFDLNYFVSDEFQILDDQMKNFRDHLSLLPLIHKKIVNIVFRNLTAINQLALDEDKTLEEVNHWIVRVSAEPINTEQFRVIIEKEEWKAIEKIFKWHVSRKIKGFTQLGLQNVKKYYDHIKSNKALQIIVEYGK